MPASSMPMGSAPADRRAMMMATLAATAIFVVMIWSYAAIQATASCHSSHGHIKVGKALSGLVCAYHDGVTQVSGF
jgi:hypothetical protein